MKLNKKSFATSLVCASLLFGHGMVFAEDEVPAAPSEVPSETPATSPSTQEQVKLEGIEVSESELLLKPNESQKIKIYAHYSDGEVKEITNNKDIVVKISSTSVVSATKNLIRAGKKTGKATVTFIYKGKSATVNVVVSKVTVQSLEVSATTLSLGKGQTKDVTLTATMSDGSSKDVTNLATWMTSDATVADVDAGSVEGVGEGVAEVTARYGGESVTITVEVSENVAELEGIEASDKNLKLEVGEEDEIKIWAVYSDGNKEEITDDIVWQPKHRSIADVVDGVIVANKPGKTSIEATYKGKSVKLSVEVVQPKVTKLEANVKKVTLAQDGTKQVMLTAILSNGKKVDVTKDAEWSVKRDTVAEVEAGLIKAIGAGTTTIVAKYEGKVVQIVVTVK
ncbi:MAG: Ig-like domain-containing protein [Anoxybacillus sp.]|nr:Ig-like domain-containing protein [Anoxybacillus sp.]MCL6586216.1 Ig-like domain-containing protein [Anoxybacillus sp.]